MTMSSVEEQTPGVSPGELYADQHGRCSLCGDWLFSSLAGEIKPLRVGSDELGLAHPECEPPDPLR